MKPIQRVIEIVPAQGAARDGLTRRQALSWMAASMALASAGCTRPDPGEAHPFVRMPEAGYGGEALYYATSFVRDGFAHGVLVGTREGRPVKVEGNPLHPASLGRSDVFAQASVLGLWDPDRSQVVLQRGAGTDAAMPSTWSSFDAAWQRRAQDLRARQGAGLRVLLPASTSPTLQAQLMTLKARFPEAQLHRHAPLAAAHAPVLASGHVGRAVPAFSRAALVVAFDADPFSGGADSVRCAADWASAREAAPSGGATRLIAIETTPGLFGARADDRLALPPAAIDAVIERLALACGVPGAGNIAMADPHQAAFEKRLLAAVRAAGPDTLCLAGPALAERSHALLHALHRRLGAVGHTVRYIATPEGDALPGLLALREAIERGEVDTLLILGGNPAYDAPGALRIGDALSRVPFSVHLGLHADETAQCCRWHLPMSHIYEQWSDARAFDGTASLIQPVIAPLYDTRSVHELLASMLDDETRNGRELLRRQWRREGQDSAGFEAFWRASLRSGVVDGSAFADEALAEASLPPAHPAHEAGTLTAVFVPDAATADGSFANNGWLQELPRPFTQITWGNALHFGPGTAASLGLRSGDVVRASAAGQTVEVPVWVQSTHAEGAATLPLGNGRKAGGTVARGIGFDAYALRPDGQATVQLTLKPTGRHVDFARTQLTLSQEDRELARTVLASRPIIQREEVAPTLYPPKDGKPAHAWAMTIDLDACTGCNACTVACQAENNIPVVGAEQVALGRVMHWIRIDHYEAPPDAAPGASGVFQPVPCMHCENAPCEIVCPVGATVHDSEGLNVQVYNRCVGTRFCSNNCPYKVRRFNFLQYSDEDTTAFAAQHNPDVTVRVRGVMEKCTYCVQRISRARLMSEKSGKPLADGDVVTACQSACPTAAIHFGDLADPASDVTRTKASPRHYALLGELDTRPRTTYLARVLRDDSKDAA
ncbi:4Fe-4S dicluster domain-containing protein [Variovorax sp. dw_308]|uniref:4Fe-4S dicluster domain-containing protein n=1 Tax=Variovorax sp. dw_308 TaxID=2721546 RepID=UPI001C460301|nr:4Fe-4S dicluster domain-containing protein [Variovorax sp. dw_308]